MDASAIRAEALDRLLGRVNHLVGDHPVALADRHTVLEHERDSDLNGADAFVARINPEGTVLSHSRPA